MPIILFRCALMCAVVLSLLPRTGAQVVIPDRAPPMPHEQMLPPVVRAPQFPLKTQRALVSDQDIQQARANIQKYPAARELAQKIIDAADQWAQWSDQDLRDVITSAEVPRAFELGTEGCPIHGKAIHEKGGTYPWIIAPKIPFKVQCPIGKEVYPTNDYETYYKSGFKTKKSWDTEYVDDGWGWVNPKNGRRYWFVAHANHWTWHGKITGGLLNMAHAYVLTGDKKYAHKAAVMLHRVAEVYPLMDYERQSRYGLLRHEENARYAGGVVNAIWETNLATTLASAYDLVWDTIDGDRALHAFTGTSGEQIRALIEANLLEQVLDNYYNGRIAGNFGMHQTTLLTTALVRQNGDNAKYLRDLLEAPGNRATYTGIRYALYNLMFCDGQPYESPGYNVLWLSKMASLAPLLQKMNVEIYQEPRMKRLHNSFLDLIAIGKFTPAVGDTGSVYGGIEGKNAMIYQGAYRAYGDERYLQFLHSFGALGEAGFKSWGDLFHAPIPAKTQLPPGRALPPQPSRLMSGYGLAFLNNRADTNGVALYYGLHGSHYHFDRLNLDLFANGQPMMPDLGYPDAMNDYVSGIYTWSKNTISHNTVTVDASTQPGNAAGIVRAFADGGFARITDLDGAGTYPQAETYRRAVTMVDIDSQRSYYVDVFSVVGGQQHDYSLHGPPGKYESVGGTWSTPAPGTLAGENVKLGEIYDNAQMGAPGYKGGFSGYRGSGFQHLSNVQTHQSGEILGQYAHEKDAAAQLRIRILPQPSQHVFAADARVSPVKFPQKLKYLIARRVAENGEEKLRSQFVSVLEPFKNQPFIHSVERLASPAGVAVLVRREGGTDLIIQDTGHVQKSLSALHSQVETDSAHAVVSFNAAGKATRVFFTGGTFLSVNGKRYQAPAPITGQIASLDARNSVVRVALAGDAITPDATALQSLAGRVVQFQNDAGRISSHTIINAKMEKGLLVLQLKDDLLLAYLRISDLSADRITTNTALSIAANYAGAQLSDANFKDSFEIASIAKSTLRFTKPLPANHVFKKGANAWMVDLSPEYSLHIPTLFQWQQ